MSNINESPWLGLMSYEEKDAHLFYGRTKEIQELSGDIFNNTQTVVYGPSGTGKTSIIKAGIFSLARNNNFLPIYIRLNHDSKESYSFQIIEKIRLSLKEIDGEIETLIEPICENNCSLWEFFHGNEFWNKENYPVVPLIVIDQFEEIFTLTKDKSIINDFFIQLSDLCDNKMPQTLREYLNSNNIRRDYPDKINYRLVLSLREDFLARLEEFAVNIPSLRRNRFSLQAINEEQAMEIILKPSDGMVSEQVAIEIIKKVTNNANFKIDGIPEITVETALLSLFCNELNKKRIEKEEDIISLDLVNDSGDNIISDFYSNTMSLVSEKTMFYLENTLLTKNGYRDSIALDDAFEYGLTPDEIDILQKNRLIRIDEWDGTKRIEFTHDVLCKVAKEKREKRELDQQLAKEKEISEKLIAERKQQNRKYRNLGILTSAVTLLLLVILYGAYCLFFKTYEDNYVIVVKRNGFIEGRKALSDNDLFHYDCHYKLTREGLYRNFSDIFSNNKKPYTKMYAINSYGKLTENNGFGTYLVRDPRNGENEGADEKNQTKIAKACQWEFILDSKGDIAYEKAYDKYGKTIYSFIYTSRKIENGKKQVFCQYSDKNGLPFKQRNNGGDYIRITYNNEGYEELHEFFDSDGNRRTDTDGAYGKKMKYNDQGLQTYNASIDQNGNLMIDKAGNCGMKADYDKNLNVIRQVSFGTKEELRAVVNGYAYAYYTYDEWGRMTSEKYYNINNKPCVDNKTLIHRYVLKYNDRGLRTSIDYYGINNKPTFSNQGFASFSYEYDKSGNLIKERYFDINGRLYLTTEGYAVNCAKYNDKSLLTEQKYFGKDEKPILSSSGYFKFTFEYDKNENVILVKYFGLDNLPCLTYQGFAGIRRNYDGENNLIEERYFDTKGHLCYCKDGYAVYRAKYNKRGHQVEYSYYDVNDKLCLSNDGYAKCNLRYDEHQNIIEKNFMGIDGLPISYKGYSRFVGYYDENGNCVEERYYDINGRLCINNDFGATIAQAKYSNFNNKIESSCYNSKYQLAVSSSGYSTEKLSYDEWNRVIKTEYYGQNGKPCLNTEKGCASYINKYDNHGNVIEIRYYGIDNRLCMISDNYAIYKARFNEKNQKVEEWYQDINGKPCLDKNSIYRCIYKYDQYGHNNEQRVYGVNNEPINCAGGWFIYKMDYNISGQVIQCRFYGTDSKPTNSRGYFSYRNIYDTRGNIIETLYYCIDEKLQNVNKGYAIEKHAYNSTNKITLDAYYDTKGKPTTCSDGYHKMIYQYNSKGQLVRQTYYGIDGKLCLTSGGYASIEAKYDSKGNNTQIIYYDTNLKPKSSNAVMADVVENGAAYNKGMRDTYVIISIGDWFFGDSFKKLKDVFVQYKDQDKTIVFMDFKGNFLTYNFGKGLVGISYKEKALSNDENKFMEEKIKEYKQNNK